MTLRNPAFLLLLLTLVPLVFLTLRRTPVPGLSPLGRYREKTAGLRTRLWFLPELVAGMFVVVWSFLLAGPEKPVDPASMDTQGLSVVIALDRSGSMGAMIPDGDSYMSRLDGVKRFTRQFLEKRTNDRFALVAFARYPETHTPLTDNRQVLADFLDLVDLPQTQDEDGTALGDAVVLSVGRLSSRSPSSGSGAASPSGTASDEKKDPGVVIVLTDGQNNCGEVSPADAATLAREQGCTVYAIGLGGEGFTMVDTPSGPMARGTGVNLDERGLRSLAEATGGKYFRADDMAQLSALYDEIARRETAKIQVQLPPKGELDLQPGIWILCGLLALVVFVRDILLKRIDS